VTLLRCHPRWITPVVPSCLFWAGACVAEGAILTLDSFDEGPHQLSNTATVTSTASITSPLADRRAVSIVDASRIAVAGSSIFSVLNTNSGELDWTVDGTSGVTRPLSISISYFQGGPYSILGMTGFELEITSLTGLGDVIVELGSATNPDGSTLRVPIDNAGVVVVPFDQLNFGTGGSLDSFDSLHFRIEAQTEQFSFTLTEIRIVPEPSTGGLIVLSGALLLRRRSPASQDRTRALTRQI
jgi:hypothetical protein